MSGLCHKKGGKQENEQEAANENFEANAGCTDSSSGTEHIKTVVADFMTKIEDADPELRIDVAGEIDVARIPS